MSDFEKLNDGEILKAGETSPLASFKPISENPDIKVSTSSLTKKEKRDKENDGAAEKLLTKEDEAKRISMTEVKFIAGDQQNGDAKIEIEGAKQVFSGLTKEELMKYANDPFWIQLRWCMFILFWTLWLLMLAGAIAIVINAPKCAPPPPKTWWEQGPLLDSAGMDFISIENNLPIFEKLGVSGVFVLDSSHDSYDVIFEPDEAKTNTYKNLAEKAKQGGIRMVVELAANYIKKTSQWFIKSERRMAPYEDYFIWSDSKETHPNEERNLPNNWVSLRNESAWTYSEVRKQFYLHQFNSSTPDLNFRNSDVVKEFDKVIKYWTSIGFLGIRIKNMKYLLVDSKLLNESISYMRGAVLTDYAFYSHARTTNQPGLGEILAHWRAVLKDNTNGEGLFTSSDGIHLKDSDNYQVNGTDIYPIDIPLSLDVSSAGARYMTAVMSAGLKNPYSESQEEIWPSWRYSSNYSELDNITSTEMQIITMLLPGVPIVRFDQITEVGDNDTIVPTKIYSEVLSLREKPSCLNGGINFTPLLNYTIFAFTRLKAGNPGVLVLYNPTSLNKTVNCAEITDVPAELTVHVTSKNYKTEGVTPKLKIPSKGLRITPRSAIVLTFVPTKNT